MGSSRAEFCLKENFLIFCRTTAVEVVDTVVEETVGDIAGTAEAGVDNSWDTADTA